VVERAYGLADNARNTPVTVETRFNIASIGKELTRAAIMQLVEQGRLSMATTIGDVSPDYPQARARTATVAQLLNHTGGVSDFFSPAFAQADKSEFASNHDYYLFVTQLPQSFVPGEREEYCNGCYVVLGEIIARVSGVTYEDYIAANVYPRAGMAHSGFLHADQTAPSVARPYGRPDGEALIDVSDMHGVAGSAAGGSYATARDLLALDNAVREGRLFGAPGARDTGGMGIAGGAPGVNAVIAGEGRWTVIVLANRSPPIASAMAQTLLRRLAGQGGAD
jgi:CubicO group peptidase (beta-lactamase class C family)